MMLARLVTLVALFACVVAARAANVQYSATEPITAYPSGESLGDLRVCVTLEPGSPQLIAFAISMPDSGQVLTAKVPAKRGANGVLNFVFTDGWENKGRGTLRVHRDSALLDLDVVNPSSDSGSHNILRNYGQYEVKRKPC